MSCEVLSEEGVFGDRRIRGVITTIVKPRHHSDRYGHYGLPPLFFFLSLPILRRVRGEHCVRACDNNQSSFGFFVPPESDSE